MQDIALMDHDLRNIQHINNTIQRLLYRRLLNKKQLVVVVMTYMTKFTLL